MDSRDKPSKPGRDRKHLRAVGSDDPPLKKRARKNAKPGKLECVTTYLEMTEPPGHPNILPSGRTVALLRAERPTLSFYRYLYNSVGERWLWWERRVMNDKDLAKIVHDDKVEVYTLYVAGVPAGFAELDLRADDDIELAYFGLIQEFIGQGLGAYLLGWVVDEAWRRVPERLWVHTCNFDHPRAFATYQRAGFTPYRQETGWIDDPRAKGVLPKGIELPNTSVPSV